MRCVVEWIVDHPRTQLVAVVAATVLFGWFVPQIHFEQDFEDFLPQDDPAVQALNRAQERYGDQKLFMVAIVAEDTIFKPETLKNIKAMEEQFEQIPGVDEVRGPTNSQVIYGTETAITVSTALPEIPTTPQELEAYKERIVRDRLLRGTVISEDGKAAGIIIRLKVGEENTVGIVEHVMAIAERYPGPERVYVGGMPRFNQFISESMSRDLRVLFPVMAMVILLVLYLSFNSVRGIVLPLATVILSAIWEVGTMALFGAPFTLFSFIAPIVLLAVGTAYGIHVLNKYYEESHKDGRSRRDVLIETVLAMASPTAMASLTTFVGFVSLLTSTLSPQRQFGVYTGIGVLYAALLALTFIPAVLALLPLPKREKRSLFSKLLQSRAGLAGLGRLVEAVPLVILLIAAGLSVFWGVGIPRLRIETSQREYLGENNLVVQALDVLDHYFGGSQQTGVEIDTKTRDGLKDPEILKKMLVLQEFLERQPGVHKTTSLVNLVRELNQKFHADDPAYYVIPEDRKLVAQLLLLFTFQGGSLGQMALTDFSAGEVIAFTETMSSTKYEQLVTKIQTYLDEHFSPSAQASQANNVTALAGSGAIMSVAQVGIIPVYARLLAQIRNSQISSLLVSTGASFAIVALLMGSAVAGLLCIIPLVLTVVTEFGLMAYVGLPLDMSTMMIGSIAIGIGIDYAIHWVERLRKDYALSGNLKNALEATMIHAGAGITYNALALILGFSVLFFSTFKGLNTFGLLIALTMVVSATSAFTVIPALLLYWRPAFLRRAAQKEPAKEVGATP